MLNLSTTVVWGVVNYTIKCNTLKAKKNGVFTIVIILRTTVVLVVWDLLHRLTPFVFCLPHKPKCGSISSDLKRL